jgi:hypothetical protein
LLFSPDPSPRGLTAGSMGAAPELDPAVQPQDDVLKESGETVTEASKTQHFEVSWVYSRCRVMC